MRLTRFTITAIVGLTTLLAVLVLVVLSGMHDAVVQTSRALQASAGQAVAAKVEAALAPAAAAVEDLDRDVAAGLVVPDHLESIEAALFGELLRRPSLLEVSFTYARATGADTDDGDLLLEEAGRGQVAVERTHD